MLQVHDAAVEVIGDERAARAALLPVRTEHEVIDDELAAPAEEIAQGLLAARSIEDVLLVHPHPGQLPPLGAERVPLPGKGLVLGEQLLSGAQPLGLRSDSRMLDLILAHDRFSSDVAGSWPALVSRDVIGAGPCRRRVAARGLRRANTVQPPAETAPLTINAALPTHKRHMGSSSSFVR